ncbi:hypothetical protein A2376_03025 [Candidatus Woesebacteria bacterium RIFOXYB1_FULL_47_31]|uniref:Heme-binding protein n=4 Tax=Candidatus Woeseibacteriota TaxID=1752722 RepID=A0A1F8D1G0_9BACT|nr:MAG: hypothetical protein A2376_03025 [Candidatus Woesebacteria bacterium RIFOXYB1_FULL_47_31]OGM86892.1 MAG: hypothetical protein A2435_01380 [Candidatus Woesebacteria bacterium RIFOXYC1_FULL_46_16]OGM88980.1 MAG: hypothetical protein A2597_03135 [Candidatus Woesebacteria bacterium RIFOXYD1_FULL_46_19]
MSERFQNKDWVRKLDMPNWVPINLEPNGLSSESNISESLEAMTDQAFALGLNRGVAFICYWPGNPGDSRKPQVTFKVTGDLERDPKPDKSGDIGTNYFGIAMSKLAYMLSTETDSGSGIRPVKNGEVSYRGGLILVTQEGSRICGGYSGGTEEQDLQIASKGLSRLIELAEGETS